MTAATDRTQVELAKARVTIARLKYELKKAHARIKEQDRSLTTLFNMAETRELLSRFDPESLK